MGHFYRTCVEGFVFCLEIVLNLARNVLELFFEISWKQYQLR